MSRVGDDREAVLGEAEAGAVGQLLQVGDGRREDVVLVLTRQLGLLSQDVCGKIRLVPKWAKLLRSCKSLNR